MRVLDLAFPTAALYSARLLNVVFRTKDGDERSGMGTCFVVKAPDGEAFVVTARHVVDPELALIKFPGADLAAIFMAGWHYSKEVEDQRTFTALFPPTFLCSEDPNVDLAIIPLKTSLALPKGGGISEWIPFDWLAAESEYLDDIRVGDFLASPGFTKLPGTELDRPVLLTGLIAGDPRFPIDVARPGGSVARAVLYQSLSRSGLSGAPVFATQRGFKYGEGLVGPEPRPLRLVGVNTGSFQDSQETPLQFSYFTRSTDLLALLSEPHRRVDWRSTRE
ncbi:hypothetical protein [Nocardioides panacisoli]|uniref:Serine protease n=1 Tax=Nocardioides panacisoli TaxID=627624 RepID=A0ABP7IGF6_9ACTN